MLLGIEQAIAGNTVGDIGQAIQHYVEDQGLSTVKDYCGHGIGQIFHDKPLIYHFATPHRSGMDVVLKAGDILTVEPMINAGKSETKILKDKWSVVTKDKSLSAQFEHTIGINAEGPPEIFTRTEE